jgi:hypothetical protein
MRVEAEPDFADWSDRLALLGLDLRHTSSVEAFCQQLLASHDRLDFIVNNACQTVRRPPDFYQHMMDAEMAALHAMPEPVRRLVGTYEGVRGYRMLPEGGAELGQWMTTNYWECMVKFSQSPWTLLHQDFRVDNLMFDKDEVAVIDWQSIGRGPAAYDLAYLLGGSVTVEARRENEEAWVRHYHSVLQDRGVEYSFDALWHDYRIAHLLGGPSKATLTGATFDLGNDRGVALIQSMAQRHFTACIDLDSLSLVS